MHFLQATEGEYIPPDRLVETFCGRNGRAYPENLVRYVLGSLSHVPQSELIEVEVGASGSGGDTFYVKRIRLTRRGQFLIDQFADSFTYLQLVVDDWRLRLPRDLSWDFQYVEPDYKYLVAGPQEYGELVKLVLERKDAKR